MNSIFKFLGIFIAGAVIGALAVSASNGNLGGVYTQVSNTFREGINVGTTNQFQVSKTGTVTGTGDATISGGTLTVTSTNTATSTLSVGCIQFYATSTATAQKFQASTTPGIMYSSYGTCPNL